MEYSLMFTLLLFTTALAVPSSQILPQRRNTRSQKEVFKDVNDESDITKYPYTVCVYSKSCDAIVGSGAILNRYWILVTAFEVSEFTADDLIVRAGSSYSDKGGQELNVSAIVLNQFYSNQYWNDIALLKTETKIVYSNYARRVGLGYFTPKPNSTAVLSGFGTSVDLDGVLRSNSITILSKDVCKEYYSVLPVTMFCATSDTYIPSAFDDFGSPLVQNKVLVGLYLGRIAEGPDVFNNIVEFKDWIVENIKNHRK